MDSILIPWLDGNGNIVISGDSGGDVLISSDTINEGVERSQVLTFRTTTGNATATLKVTQKGRSVFLRSLDDDSLRDTDGKVLISKA